MADIPSNSRWDSAWAAWADPYRFISRECRRLHTDIFQTRVLLRPTICLLGSEAARLFYDSDHLQRAGATPGRIEKTLFGQGGVQGLDGDAHRHRKQMFVGLATPERVAALAQTMADCWRLCAQRWASQPSIVLYDELHEVLCRAAFAWAGLPLPETDVPLRTREMTAMFDRAGAIGLGHWWSRLARRGAEHGLRSIVRQIRGGQLHPPNDSPADVVASYRDITGKLLSDDVAAVELLNVVRPIVAVSVFLTLSALALHEHPACRENLAADRGGCGERFVQEVRRYYPFFPMVAALARRDFQWRGYHFPRGRRVVLDLYGTNHDPRIWDEPEAFRPERFLSWDSSPFRLIPQGGGDVLRDHRCPGEPLTIALMKVALRILTSEMQYEVPPQNLELDFARIPALPRSRFILSKVRLLPA